jgi:acetamidase/formamidase
MAYHVLRATCETVHLGGFSHQLKPALEMQSGDRVEIESYTGFSWHDQAPPEFITSEFTDIYHNLPSERKVASGPHLMTGPIYIHDAQPGDVLEVKIESVYPRSPIGYNLIRPGKGALPELFTELRLRFIELDLKNNTAEFPVDSGIHIPLKPFFGIMGVATEDSARCSIPPGNYGGNIDNRHLQAGSTLFLPVFVPGALFSVGDGHTAQGDGEVNLTAIETALSGVFQIKVRKDLRLTQPIAETPTHWIVHGFGESLDQAFENALKEMIQFLCQFIGLDAEEAYVLCSLAVNFHITQVVNLPHKGVHGMLAKALAPMP